MPANISGTPFNSFGISFIQKQSCWRKSDDILRCSMGQRTIKLSTNTLNNRILTSVARQSTKDINAWKRDEQTVGNDSNLLIVFYVQIMPDDFVMQLHRF
ncbi:T3SS effector EspM [Escherichia coli]|nr:T3SS effector EspM [Escherichia coli]